MKKMLYMLMVLCFLSNTVLAAQPAKPTIKNGKVAAQSISEVYLNGKQISLETLDLTMKGKDIYVSIRKFGTSLGAEFKDEANTYIFNIDEKQIKFLYKRNEYGVVGDKIKKLKKPAIKKEDDYLISKDDLVKMFDCEITIEGSKLTIISASRYHDTNAPFTVPYELGGRKLTDKQLKDLKNSSFEEFCEKITTLEDFMAYLKVNNFSNEYKGKDIGDIQFRKDKIIWAVNKNVETVFEMNAGNCGGVAKLLRYALDEDYEDVGYIHYSTKDWKGGHTFNYIKCKDKYYVIDMTQYYHTYSFEHRPILVLDSLKGCVKYYVAPGQYELNDVIAYDCLDELLLGIGDNGVDGMLPVEYKDFVDVLFLDDGAEEIKFIFVPEEADYPKEYNEVG